MQFRDLKTQYDKYRYDINDAIQRVLLSTNFIGGKEVKELEERLAEYVGVKHCITCANGTDAMTLVLMALGIKAGDVVFVPDFTFFSTAEVVSYCGATRVFVDVCRSTFNLDPDKLDYMIQKTINEGTKKPKVIIPVDLFGLPAKYPEISSIAKKYNLFILEDGAQGFGGRIKGQKACSFGDAATTSFFPAKPFGCYGDGGAVFTNDDELASLINSLKVHGKGNDKYDNVRVGINSRLDTIQAAILKVKLEAFIKHELEDVNRIFHLYNKKLPNTVEVPMIHEEYFSSFALYTIKLSNRTQRDGLMLNLKNLGIPSAIYYKKPLHKQGAFSHLNILDKDYKVTNELCDIVLSLPMHPYLTEKEIDYIANSINDYISQDN